MITGPLVLEDELQPFQNAQRQLCEIRAAVVDCGAGQSTRDPFGQVGRAGNLQKVAARRVCGHDGIPLRAPAGG